MKNFLKKIQSHKVLLCLFSIIISSLVAIIIWPLLDFLYASFITHTAFIYSPFDHILMPVIVCTTIDIVLFIPTIGLEKLPRKSTTKTSKKPKKK
ncbi:hypothetical protein IKF40_01240 [Candidatus Saccharibacteria bacterium]|nr:hypothetical protein [Candidatus Saccharibacteria bacterium]